MKYCITFILIFAVLCSSTYAQGASAIDHKVGIYLKYLDQKVDGYTPVQKKIIFTSLAQKFESKIETQNIDSHKIPLVNQLIDSLRRADTRVKILGLDRSQEFYRKTLQNSALSCEISATSDILSTLTQSSITESQLISKISKSWFKKKALKKGSHYYWGNPNKGFVGYIDTDDHNLIASQYKMTGYGVYEAPIAKLYHDYGFKTQIINQSDYHAQFGPRGHLIEILEAFSDGNFVQLWGDMCTDPQFEDGELELSQFSASQLKDGKNAKNECISFSQSRNLYWYYYDNGKYTLHTGIIGEHNFYLLGYRGTIYNPTHIIVWDTLTGRHIYPLQEWMRKWKALQYRSIIIYPN